MVSQGHDYINIINLFTYVEKTMILYLSCFKGLDDVYFHAHDCLFKINPI